jgi:hypothetical protein
MPRSGYTLQPRALALGYAHRESALKAPPARCAGAIRRRRNNPILEYSNTPPARNSRTRTTTRTSTMCLTSTFNPLRGCNSPEGTFDLWCSRAFGLVRQAHQRGGLASNPKPQWSLVVAKPDHEHGIRRCDQFIGGGGAPKCSPRPRW